MASSRPELVAKVLENFVTLSKKPEVFLSCDQTVASRLEKWTKNIYDVTKVYDKQQTDDALPELIVDGFDDEQVWQELELQNDATVDGLLKKVAHLVTAKNLGFEASYTPPDVQDASEVEPDGMESEDEMYSGDDEDNEGEEENEAEEDLTESNGEPDEMEERGPFDGGDNSDSESEEEKELKILLDKASSLNQNEENEDSDISDIHFDDDTKKSSKNKLKQRITESSSESDDQLESKPTNKQQKGRTTVVDDKFFKVSELETFLELEDAREERRRKRQEGGLKDDNDDEEEDEENDQLFGDIPSDEEEAGGKSTRDFKYEDFFDAPDTVPDRSSRIKKQDEDEEEEEDGSGSEEEHVSDSPDDGNQKKSLFEIRQERLRKKISTLEETNLANKPWQLMGEVSAMARPENSLLQEDLDFEHQTRLAPEITEEVTKTLEDIIKQRVNDQAWDDVERMVKPSDVPFQYKKRMALDQEKSKMSLGEIYEQEYLKQAKEEEDAKDPQHEDIQKSMTALFMKLDALAHFHFTPKHSSEVKVLSNLPSVTVEEVAPVTMNDAALLAPEEIHEKTRKELKGDTERTKEDKKADLRAKKVRQHKKKLQSEAHKKLLGKVNPGLADKFAKEKDLKDLEKQSKGMQSRVTIVKETKDKSRLTASGTFFTKLQDEVSKEVRGIREKRSGKKKNKQTSAAKLKL